jgi:hypothetical protein
VEIEAYKRHREREGMGTGGGEAEIGQVTFIK